MNINNNNLLLRYVHFAPPKHLNVYFLYFRLSVFRLPPAQIGAEPSEGNNPFLSSDNLPLSANKGMLFVCDNIKEILQK